MPPLKGIGLDPKYRAPVEGPGVSGRSCTASEENFGVRKKLFCAEKNFQAQKFSFGQSSELLYISYLYYVRM
jgi:hypothetical protein